MNRRRILLITFIIFLFMALLPSPSLALKNEPEGFRGIKWDEPAEKYKDMIFAFKQGGKNYYYRQDDKPYIGKAYIGNVLYEFDDTGFASASFSFSYLQDAPYNKVPSYFAFQNGFQEIYNLSVKQWGIPDKRIVPDRNNITTKTCIYIWDFSKAAVILKLYTGKHKEKNMGLVDFNIFSSVSLDRGTSQSDF